jgi:hypothetical protein
LRRIVRAQHDTCAEFERDLEETADQKRIGDIVHVEFIEAKQLNAVEPLPRDRAETVVATRFVDEPPVHLAQEFVEVDASLHAVGQLEYGIDDEVFAASR